MLVSGVQCSDSIFLWIMLHLKSLQILAIFSVLTSQETQRIPFIFVASSVLNPERDKPQWASWVAALLDPKNTSFKCSPIGKNISVIQVLDTMHCLQDGKCEVRSNRNTADHCKKCTPYPIGKQNHLRVLRKKKSCFSFFLLFFLDLFLFYFLNC